MIRQECGHLPRLRDVMRERGCTGAEVWALVRAGHYVAYRCFMGRHWKWRLHPQDGCARGQAAVG